MNRKVNKIIAIILISLIILSGCSFKDAIKDKLYDEIYGAGFVKFSDIEYKRPDTDLLKESAEQVMKDAITVNPDDTEGLVMIMSLLSIFFEEYMDFGTMYHISHIYYCKDLTDEYWTAEYEYCTENISSAERIMEDVMRTIANSPVKEPLERDYLWEGYFDEYVGESIWDDELEKLFQREYDLQNEYYKITESALGYEYGSAEFLDLYADELTKLLIKLVTVRKEISSYFGYDDYADFANEYYHYRDYTSSDTMNYLISIRDNLSPVYARLKEEIFFAADSYCSEKDTLNYLKKATKNMGGNIYRAFRAMVDYELYDISYGKNKYNTSYEILIPSYMQPYIFVSPGETNADKLIFAHEFGHFCNDYVSNGTIVGTDVAEIFSQGMEYLSLCYSDEDTSALTKYRIGDSLCTYVEQAAFSYFEQKLYRLSEDELTVENIYEVYDSVAEEFNFTQLEYDKSEFTHISHFFVQPMYMMGYVISEDAALQIYEAETENKGSGLKIMEDNLNTQEISFMAFIESVGLENPTLGDRVLEVKELYEEILFATKGSI